MMRTREPLVSFIVPAYNYGRFLSECLESIFQQRATDDFDVIVLDDASTDETPQVVQTFSDPRLLYVRHNENRGTAATISDALGLTRGKYVAQLDSDDRYRRDFLEITLPILEAHPDLAMVYGDVAGMDETGTVFTDPWEENHARQLHDGQPSQGNELLLMLLYNPSSSAARLMRGDLARALAPFPNYVNGRFGPTDWFMNVWLTRHNDVYYLPRTLGDYRIHSANQHSQPRQRLSYEQTIFNILDHLFAEPPGVLRQRGLKPRVYGIAYLRLANGYFGNRNFVDARRCYLQALRWHPRTFLAAGGMHRLIGTGLGEKRYARIKNTLRGWLVRSE